MIQRVCGVVAFILATGLGGAAEPEKKPIAFVLHKPHDMVGGLEDNPRLGDAGVFRRGQRGWLEANFEIPVPAGAKPAFVPARTVLDRSKNEAFTVELEFPHADAAKAPLRVTGILRMDVDGRGLEGSIAVPEHARLGKQKVRVSWKEFRAVVAGNCDIQVEIKSQP